jgi:hypothetical protein
MIVWENIGVLRKHGAHNVGPMFCLESKQLHGEAWGTHYVPRLLSGRIQGVQNPWVPLLTIVVDAQPFLVMIPIAKMS